MTFISSIGYWAYFLVTVVFSAGFLFMYGGYKIKDDDALRVILIFVGLILVGVGIGLIIT